MAKSANWTREETIVAFYVYCKIPFKSSSKTHPTVIKYANILGRTPSALNMKIGNFGRLDPELRKQGIIGLGNGSRMDEEVWNEFQGNWDALTFESERRIAELQHQPIEKNIGIDLENLPSGEVKEQLVRTRVNQSFFRSAVLSSYNIRCCITGIHHASFLHACHIVPWHKDKTTRTNPQNGLCLSALHHKAYDEGFISVTPDYEITISDAINNCGDYDTVQAFFLKYNRRKITLPDRFLPKRDYLDYHFTQIFKG